MEKFKTGSSIRKKVIFVSSFSPPEGGAARVVYDLAKFFSKEKFDISIASHQSGFENLKSHKIDVTKLHGIKIGRDYLPTFASFFKIIKIVWPNNIIFVHTPYAVLSLLFAFFGKIFQKKIICMCHGTIEIYWRNFFNLKIMNLLADKWFFLSENDKKFVEQFTGKITKYAFIENGVDQKVFIFQNKKKAFATKFLFIGRLEKQKGITFMLRLLSDFPDFEFGFVGDGNFRKKMQNYKNARIYGTKGQYELIKIAKEYDCFVFPSLKESYPISLLEMLSLGIPVIAFRSSPTIDKIVGQNGIVVPLNDYQKLQDAVLNMANSLVNVSPEKIKELSWESKIVKYEKEVENLF